MVITAFNPPTKELEKSYLMQAYSAGITAVDIKNNDRFTNNSKVMIGELGREKTEIVTMSGVPTPGTRVTLTTTVFPHEADEPVYQLRFDQVKFYRSTSGANGTYALVSTQTVDVDNADKTTKYEDATGLSTYYYKVSYYNSVTTTETDLSDPIQGAGYARNTVGFLMDELFVEFKDPNEQIVSKSQVLGWFNEVNDDLQQKTKVPFDFLYTRTTLGTTANTDTISFPTDSNGKQIMWKYDIIEFLYNDGASINELRPIRDLPLREFRYRFQSNATTNNNDQLQYVALDTAVDKFRLYPRPLTTRAGTVYLYYWKYFDELNGEADVFETPNQRVYKMYALSMYYRIKSQSDTSFAQMSTFYAADYQNAVAQLIKTNAKVQGRAKAMAFLPQTVKGFRRY